MPGSYESTRSLRNQFVPCKTPNPVILTRDAAKKNPESFTDNIQVEVQALATWELGGYLISERRRLINA